MNTPKICAACGIEFIDRKHPDRKYCSHHCAMEVRKVGKGRNCRWCNRVFDTDNRKQFYCSRECSKKGQGAKPHPDKHELRKCVFCGETFETYSYRPTRHCSQSCARKAYNAKNGFRRVMIFCEVCGKEYVTKLSHVFHRGSNFCSKQCFAIGTSYRIMGANNPNYRGGSTTSYRGPNWGTQKRKALKRDGYRCQICHKKISRVKWDYGVHHIIPFRDFNGDYHSANELNNLVTLCRSCHSDVEWGIIPCPRPLF